MSVKYADNLAVFTVKQIMQQVKPVLHVYRDDIEDLQFMPGFAVDEGDLMIVGLGEMLLQDPSLSAIVEELPSGFMASRKFVGDEWKVEVSGLD